MCLCTRDSSAAVKELWDDAAAKASASAWLSFTVGSML
jgi:hypothetical protein